MKFFYGCTNEKEAKEIYRKLAKCFHPDKGGSDDLMIELKKQYDNWDEPVVSNSGGMFTPNNFGRYSNGLGGTFDRLRPTVDIESSGPYQTLKFHKEKLEKDIKNQQWEIQRLATQIKLLIEEKLDQESRLALYIPRIQEFMVENKRITKVNEDLVYKLKITENARSILEESLTKCELEISRLTKLKEPPSFWNTVMNKIGNLTE